MYMDKYINIAWLFAVATSWISFGVASWEWADHGGSRALLFALFWLVMSVAIFYAGFRAQKKS
jgi:hypothetical protein